MSLCRTCWLGEGSCLREGGTCGAEHSPLRGRSPGRGQGHWEPLGSPHSELLEERVCLGWEQFMGLAVPLLREPVAGTTQRGVSTGLTSV